MSEIKTAAQLADACLDVAKNHKTLYILGCFGAPMTAANKARYSNNLEYNRQILRTTKIKAATSNTFGFDCVNLIKGLLWGWNGDASRTYGGAKYNTDGVPDISADQMIKVCKEASTDFSKIQVGEAVWMAGHIGVYVGDGLAVECTPKWDDGVQITAVHNIGKKSGYNGRSWTKHGKLPYVTYETVNQPEPAPAPVTTKKEEITVNVSVLRKGDKGGQVKALQALLIGYGCSCGSSGADGDFGSATDKALRNYQKAKGLTVDGICGPATWGSLLGVER